MSDNHQTNPTQIQTTAPETAEPAKPPDAADKLLPFRPLFELPVAVQFAGSVPYLQIGPMLGSGGRPETRRLLETKPNGESDTRVIGLPALVEPATAQAVAIGILRPAPCGTWLIIEELVSIPRGGEFSGGHARMDVYIRPETVTHISFVKEIHADRQVRSEN